MQQDSVQAARQALLEVFRAALVAVDGRRAVAAALNSAPPPASCALIALGKAAEAMAHGARDALGERICDGLVVTKRGYAVRDSGFETLESAHPVPDATSLAAGRALLAFIQRQPLPRPLLFLISGGTSSLLEVPRPGIDPEFLARANQWLLGSGLAIDQINTVRKSLSAIKAGRLLNHLAGRAVSALLISDVPGDDPAVIGSGLLVPDPNLAERARQLELPPWLAPAVQAPLVSAVKEGPDARIIARLADAKQAAVQHARALGLRAHQHAEFLGGDAEETGRRLGRYLRSAAPGVHVWGGETTVRLPSQPGRGGRNQHLALAAATELDAQPGLFLLAAGTDGSDGPTEEAGALVDAGTLQRAAHDGFDAAHSLLRADAGSLLEASADLVHTGPTGSNVMDLVLGLKVDEQNDQGSRAANSHGTQPGE